MKNIKDYADKDYLLGLLGLETKSTFGDWVLPSLGIFSFGFLLGATVISIVSPSTVKKIGSNVRDRVNEATNVVGGLVNRTAESASSAFRSGGIGEGAREF